MMREGAIFIGGVMTCFVFLVAFFVSTGSMDESQILAAMHEDEDVAVYIVASKPGMKNISSRRSFGRVKIIEFKDRDEVYKLQEKVSKILWP